MIIIGPEVNSNNLELVSFIQDISFSASNFEVLQVESNKRAAFYFTNYIKDPNDQANPVDLTIGVDKVVQKAISELEKMNLFPNPAEQYFNVQFEEALTDAYD